jgi:hypothetical protein
MPGIAGAAQIAFAAACIDLTYYALPDQMWRIVARLDHTDKLVTDRSVEPGITAHDLEIRVANSRFNHA